MVPQLLDLFDKQARELDLDKRKEIIQEIEVAILNDPVTTNLYWRVDHLLINKQIQNFFFKDHIRKYESIWCGPAC